MPRVCKLAPARQVGRSGAKRRSLVACCALIVTLLSVSAAAAAASQGTSTGGFGAETTVVASCGTGMKFAYTASYDSGIRGYAIDGVAVSDIPAGCLNRSLTVTFYGADADDTAVGSSATATLPSSGTAVLIPIAPRSNTVDAGLVSGMAVVVA